MDQAQILNLSSARAKKARLSVLFDKKWLRMALVLCAGLSLVSGSTLLFIGENIGYLLLACASWVSVPVLWYHGELKDLPATAQLEAVAPLDAVLERTLLGRLPRNLNPQSLATSVMKTPGGIFYANRYAISLDFIKTVLGNQPADLATIWAKAVQLSATVPGETRVTDTAVAAALILSAPNASFYLSQLQLDEDDIISGLLWRSHIRGVFEKLRSQKHSGGLGRDFSFGWAPLLNRVGMNVTESIERGGLLHRDIEGHQDIIKQMMHVLAQRGRRNATLVGEVGVGKTTLVHALAQKLISDPKGVSPELRYRQIIELDAASLISRAKGRGELENLLIRLFNEAIHAKNIILFLDEAQLFLQDGVGSVDLSSVLLPVLEGGGLPVIIALSDQEWLRLSQLSPGLAQLMNRIVVSPLEKPATLRVMEDQVLLLEGRNPVVYMHQALIESYNLADRFIRDQAFPGKAIRLLEAAAGFAEDTHFITAKSVQQAVEKSFDVKVQTASSSEERDTLLNLEGKIHERMINQTRAVQVVSDALRRARAGVRNQNKPIGTFLFLGPTGVGKTELSKALAEVYFGGEDRLVRVDLNEFSQAQDVSRLLEIGSGNTNSLTAQIAKQPFSVVLLDEIEKAHPNVLNVLLQLLDEGMLRDSDNKQVSFRDAIVIATSNAGADKIRAHIEAGEALEQFEDQFINELIDANLFRPEFINRFDETVLFRPLTVEELKQVVDLILTSINKTLGAQKVSVRLTDAAKEFLAQAGYDPRLGARPLRRVTQRSIENIMAQKLLSGQVMPGTTIELDAPELQAALQQRQNQ
ncbi:MAG: ATP-dependent Clp protease ATP-binding subunit ClpC [Patescibacteria group bacterium]|nr:ATP-dependent Clp protease ATP-binding subunit ClpC [Patescibacteria group bacterium]